MVHQSKVSTSVRRHRHHEVLHIIRDVFKHKSHLLVIFLAFVLTSCVISAMAHVRAAGAFTHKIVKKDGIKTFTVAAHGNATSVKIDRICANKAPLKTKGDGQR